MLILLALACATEEKLPNEELSDEVADDSGDDAMEYVPEGGYCAYSPAAIGSEEATPGGWLPSEAIAATSGERASTLSWDHSGEETGLTLEVVYGEDPASLWTGEWVWHEGAAEDPSLIEDCPAYVTLSGALRFVTEDGRVDDEVPVEVVSWTGETGRIDAEIAQADLGGTGPVLPEGAEAWTDVRFEFAINVSAGSQGGELAIYGESGSDSVANDMARWE